MIIVFGALMALIALVTIGIDWIGRPLKHRRFIPRLYRFDDEKLPVDAYGHPQLDAPQPDTALTAGPLAPAAAWAPPAIYQQPPPVVVATVPEPLTAASAPSAPPLPPVEDPAPGGPDAESTLDYDAFLAGATEATTTAPNDTGFIDEPPNDGPPDDDELDNRSSRSAFSDRLLAADSGSVPAVGDAAWAATGLVPDQQDDDTSSGDAGQTIEIDRNTTTPDDGRADEADGYPISAAAWKPGMALDATVNDERPSLATKAERYWQATAASVETSHFDAEAIERMASGRAPRRRNPRTSRVEIMQLTGLRRASTREDVRMSWPDSSVDPWAAS